MHEFQHHISLADCGRSLFRSGELRDMEREIRSDENSVIRYVEDKYKTTFDKLLAARTSMQETIYSDSLWLAPWVKDQWAYGRASAGGHNGTDGC